MATVESRVKTVIAFELGVGESDLKPGASFMDDLGADSLDGVELAMALEEEFGIEIPDADVDRVKTVQDAIDYITAHAK